MEERGQVYFDAKELVTEADRKRYVESLKEEADRLHQQFEEHEVKARKRLEELARPGALDEIEQKQDTRFLG
jgi:acetyl-CoA carboxylase carboxyltransferase component